ncbi:MAG: hypothetical protein LBU77_04475 [Clostridiales bacterium]|nr:hypothetical protein [Clostridiales bacterium]
MDWTALGTSLLYEYACDIPATAFTGAYKQKTNLLSARFDVFNRIMLIPGETVRVLFHIAATDQCHEFTITDSDLTTQLLMARENISVANNQLYYIASSAYRANLFSDHVFIPVWDSEALAYANIEKINPYADDNNIILNDTVENNINMFFNNPARKQNARINDVLTFSDETTVVKYHQSNVLECNNYQTVDDSITTTFASAYNQAVGFIKRDTTITENDDYYLADYKQDPNGNWLLYFDFTVNDLPVFISNRGGSTPELAHAIEITVSHDIVTKYMRSAFLYRASEQSISEVTVNGMDALNTACANYALPEDEGGEVEYPELIQSIDLGYSIDNSDSTSLYWYIGYTGITRPYAFSANYRGEE